MVHHLQTLSLLSMWVVETIQEAGCMHCKQSMNTCVAMTRAIAQGEDGVKAICNQTLGRKFSLWKWVSFLHKTKQTLRYPGNWIEPSMGSLPLICYFCQIFKRVGRKICGVQNEQHVWLTGTFWPEKPTNVLQERGVYLSFNYCILASSGFMEFILLFDLANLETYWVCHGSTLKTLLCAHLVTFSLPEVTDLRTLEDNTQLT